MVRVAKIPYPGNGVPWSVNLEVLIITIAEDLSYSLPSMALDIPCSSCTALAPNFLQRTAFEIQEYCTGLCLPGLRLTLEIQ